MSIKRAMHTYVIFTGILLGSLYGAHVSAYYECTHSYCEMDRIEIYGSPYDTPFSDPFHDLDYMRNWPDWWNYNPYDPLAPAEPKPDKPQPNHNCRSVVTTTPPFTATQTAMFNSSTSDRQAVASAVGGAIGGLVGSTIGNAPGAAAGAAAGAILGHWTANRPTAICGRALQTKMTICDSWQSGSGNHGTVQTQTVTTAFVYVGATCMDGLD